MNKKLMVALLMMVALAVLLIGCGQPGAPASLEGTSWVLTSLNGSAPIAGTEITLAFEGGEGTGFAGCNSYFGSYTVEAADKLTFSAVGSTEMACLEPEGVMEQEAEYLDTLRAATGVRLSAGELQILSAGGRLLVFRRA